MVGNFRERRRAVQAFLTRAVDENLWARVKSRKRAIWRLIARQGVKDMGAGRLFSHRMREKCRNPSENAGKFPFDHMRKLQGLRVRVRALDGVFND